MLLSCVKSKMSLGDAFIACALINETPLVTRNSSDFDWIDNLNVINPFDTIGLKNFEINPRPSQTLSV